MTDHLEKYLQEEIPEISKDHRNLQRMALAQALKLSKTAVEPVETEIETAFQSARSSTEKRYRQALEKIEAGYQADSESARQQYQQQKEEIRSACDAKLRGLEEQVKDNRDKISSSAEIHVTRSRKNCEYEVMMAETVEDGAMQKCKQERHEVERAIPAAKGQLDQTSDQVQQLLAHYHFSPPPWQDPIEPSEKEMSDPVKTFREKKEAAGGYYHLLYNLTIPRLFIGIWPYFFLLLLCAIVVGLIWLLCRQKGYPLSTIGLMAGAGVLAALIGSFLGGKILWKKSRVQIARLYNQFQRVVMTGHVVLDRHLQLTLDELDRRVQQIHEKRKIEETRAREQFETVKANVAKRRDDSLAQMQQEYQAARQEIEESCRQELQKIEENYQTRQNQLQQEHDQQKQQLERQFQQDRENLQQQYEAAHRKLENRWQEGLSCMQAMLTDLEKLDHSLQRDWGDPFWRQWKPVDSYAPVVRFGSFQLDLNQLAESVLAQAKFHFDKNEPVSLPALLAFPDRCSLLLQTHREGREQAIAALRAVMTRLVTSLPPGRVHFTILDPIGIGENFAGFMHATDYDEALVGRRIWTDSAQIQQQLTDLTEHMENVIQKYLRNEFETIEEYNQQAGELAEPYRFLVIADFPHNFNEESARRLSSIINSGARCGVYTLIACDARQELPIGIDVQDLASHSAHLIFKDGRFVWQDEIFRKFPLALDAPPAEELLTQLIHTMGRAAKDSSRVEVPFEIIAPPENRFWSEDSSSSLNVPVGRTGATRLQYLKIGKGVAQHMLIAGKTGSGKSTLLHVIITNLALWYSPDQVELYLIDFKKGVEFKTYVTHQVPHIRAVAIESDREFGLSILRRLEAEMTRRGDLFRKAGVQDLASYRAETGNILPRTVLIVDEFQVFFSEDDKLGQDAAILLEQLVRQGRAFGVHVLLGSQTLGGASGLARSTMGQMAVRIALQCSEADSQLILDDDNVAARLLSRPGEAIYNDAGGMVVGNCPFQTAWLPESTRDEYLNQIAKIQKTPTEPMIVFEGNIPADFTTNRKLSVCLNHPASARRTLSPYAWLGEPVAIKDPTAVVFRRQSGANLLLVGQQDVGALGVINAVLVSLAAQLDRQSARFFILEGSAADSPHAGQLQKVAAALPHEHRNVEWRAVPEAISEIAGEVQNRIQADQHDAPAIYLFIYGLQRYRILRRQEEEFGFSMDQEAAPKPDKQFAEIIREGPPVGVHVIVWADTLSAVERSLNRQTIREFDNRVLFQMGAADSSNLIDSPIANQLGFHRALFFSEEQGLLEKFRPYAPLSEDWLALVSKKLTNS